jgi:hypothetical protein
MSGDERRRRVEHRDEPVEPLRRAFAGTSQNCKNSPSWPRTLRHAGTPRASIITCGYCPIFAVVVAAEFAVTMIRKRVI